jgi:ELWxxDGT repeat protein
MVRKKGEPTTGSELWATDGSPIGTIQIKDINPGPKGSYPFNFTIYNGKLYFIAHDSAPYTYDELWSTDGSTLGTTIIRKSNTKYNNDAGTNGLTLFKNKLFFRANSFKYGSELWSSDGTNTGTKIVKDINSGKEGSRPFYFTVLGDKLLFSAFDEINYIELWITDGTSKGTYLLKDINPGNGNSYPSNFTLLADKLIFSADDGTNGDELWITDGKDSGTILLKDINQQSGRVHGSSPEYFTELNGSLYFIAQTTTGYYELYVTDGTTEGTVKIEPANIVRNNNPLEFVHQLIQFNGELYFAANYNKSGKELWKLTPSLKTNTNKY